MTYIGADGRKWTQLGPRFWQADDATVIETLDQILPDGRTKAERYWGEYLFLTEPLLPE